MHVYKFSYAHLNIAGKSVRKRWNVRGPANVRRIDAYPPSLSGNGFEIRRNRTRVAFDQNRGRFFFYPSKQTLISRSNPLKAPARPSNITHPKRGVSPSTSTFTRSPAVTGAWVKSLAPVCERFTSSE